MDQSRDKRPISSGLLVEEMAGRDIAIAARREW
jgi:hypothetical protein